MELSFKKLYKDIEYYVYIGILLIVGGVWELTNQSGLFLIKPYQGRVCCMNIVWMIGAGFDFYFWMIKIIADNIIINDLCLLLNGLNL